MAVTLTHIDFKLRKNIFYQLYRSKRVYTCILRLSNTQAHTFLKNAEHMIQMDYYCVPFACFTQTLFRRRAALVFHDAFGGSHLQV